MSSLLLFSSDKNWGLKLSRVVPSSRFPCCHSEGNHSLFQVSHKLYFGYLVNQGISLTLHSWVLKSIRELKQHNRGCDTHSSQTYFCTLFLQTIKKQVKNNITSPMIDQVLTLSRHFCRAILQGL